MRVPVASGSADASGSCAGRQVRRQGSAAGRHLRRTRVIAAEGKQVQATNTESMPKRLRRRALAAKSIGLVTPSAATLVGGALPLGSCAS